MIFSRMSAILPKRFWGKQQPWFGRTPGPPDRRAAPGVPRVPGQPPGRPEPGAAARGPTPPPGVEHREGSVQGGWPVCPPPQGIQPDEGTLPRRGAVSGVCAGQPMPARPAGDGVLGPHLGLLGDVQHQLELLGHGQVFLRGLLRSEGKESVHSNEQFRRHRQNSTHEASRPGPRPSAAPQPGGPTRVCHSGGHPLPPERVGGRAATPP